MNKKGCPNCGRMVDENAMQCPYCQYDFQKINELFEKYNDEKKIHVPKYAGFIKRTVAIGVDNFILGLILLIINSIYIYLFVPNYLSEMMNPTPITIIKLNFIWLLYPIIYLLYCSLRQSSKNMGTIGEKLVGIEVVDENESPIEFSTALKRNIARLLNILTLSIGYIIIIFTKKKQDLSDMIAKTYVLNRITNENYNKYSYASAPLRLLAWIIDTSFLWLLSWVYIYGISLLIKHAFSTLDLSASPHLLQIITINLSVVVLLIIILYFPYMEKHQGGTLGKLILKIKVVDLKGERIGFFKSILRLICLTIEQMIPLGTILCFVTPRKQTLKDLMTKTIVIHKH